MSKVDKKSCETIEDIGLGTKMKKKNISQCESLGQGGVEIVNLILV